MNIQVNKKDLIGVILEALSEDAIDTPEFQRVSMDEDPIKPVEMMATQIAEEMPPVADPEYVPAGLEELGRAAYVIAQEVPDTQIEYFYRKLHKLLDSALDRDQEQGMQIESFRNILSVLLSESMTSQLMKRAVSRLEAGEDAYEIASEYIRDYSEFEDQDEADLANKIQMMSYGIDDGEAEGSTEVVGGTVDLAHDEPYVSPHEDYPKEEEPELEADEEEADKEDYTDEDYDSDLDRETADQSAESIAADIVDLIMKKDLHTQVKKDPNTGKPVIVPVVIIDQNGDFKMSEKESRVLAPESYGFEIIKTSLEMSDILSLFSKLSKAAGGDKAAYLWLYSNLSDVLKKEGDPVSSELAAEMHANRYADTIGKYGEVVRDQLLAAAEAIEKNTEDTVVQIGMPKKVKVPNEETGEVESVEDWSDVLEHPVPPDELAAAFRLVADQRLEAPRRGRPRLYDEDEPREAMTPEMKKQIRAERRKAELELEYEPGKMHLSPKALRAMMDDIATNLGVSLGNVRNVIYDDLKVYGLPAEDLRKMAQADKIPGGREKIPFTYDPLRVQAKEKIVEKLYDMYRNAMMSYVEEVASSDDEEDRDIGESYRDLFFGDGGFYQPGLDGYVALQSQVGGPTMDDPDSVDVDDIAFRTKRKAYDFVQEFIDQIAKEWLDPNSPEYKQAKEGGMRAFLNSLVNDEIFSDVNSRADIDEIIDKEVNDIESNFDEDKLKEIIDVVFDKAPRRTKKYIARVKKELGK